MTLNKGPTSGLKLLLATLAAFLTVSLAGCDSSSSDNTQFAPQDATGPRPGISTGTILVDFPGVDAQGATTGYRFVGIGARPPGGTSPILYGPVDFAAGADVTLNDVPLAVQALMILPLAGQDPTDAFAHRVDLATGFFVIDDPLDPDGRANAIDLDPAAPSIIVGATASFDATGIFLDGFTFDVTNIATWATDDGDVASIDQEGLATGLTVGDTEVSATLSGVSGTADLTVLGIPTTLVVTSSVNPTVFGQSVTFTATIDSATLTPEGDVTFFDGNTVLGTATLSNGSASVTTDALSTGTHAITATFDGDETFAASSSNEFSQVVNTADGGISIGSSANPAVFSEPVTLTAIITAQVPGAGTPTGVVTFFDGANDIGSTTLSGGEGAITVSNLSVGSHNITVSYSGDANFNAQTSDVFLQTVTKAETATTVVSSLNPSVFGQTVTFTAEVESTGFAEGVPAGTVTFFDGATSLGVATLNGAGQASLAVSTLGADNPAAQHSITARYNGNTNYNTSTSDPLIQEVSQAITMIEVDAPSNTSVFGQSVTFTATITVLSPGTGTPTGSVRFFLNGGLAFTDMVVSPGSTPGEFIGTWTVSDLDVTPAMDPHDIVAQFVPNNTNFAGSDNLMSPWLQTVTPATPGSVTVGTSLNPASFGEEITFTATVAGNAFDTPTGNVQFVAIGPSPALTETNLGAPVALDVNGSTSTVFGAPPNTLAIGTYVIEARYQGAGNFGPATGTLNPDLVVNAAATSTAVTSSADPETFGTQVTLTATVTPNTGTGVPTGSVIFFDGATQLNPVAVTLDGMGQATLTTDLAVGERSITAEYTSDSPSFVDSVSTIFAQTILSQSTTVITESPAGTYVFTVTATSLGATVNPSGLLEIFVAGNSQGTVQVTAVPMSTPPRSVVTFTPNPALGSMVNIDADYLGDNTSTAASSATTFVTP